MLYSTCVEVQIVQTGKIRFGRYAMPVYSFLLKFLRAQMRSLLLMWKNPQPRSRDFSASAGGVFQNRCRELAFSLSGRQGTNRLRMVVRKCISYGLCKSRAVIVRPHSPGKMIQLQQGSRCNLWPIGQWHHQDLRNTVGR